jgi:hypothetical protein
MYGMGASVSLLQDQQNLILIQIVFSIAIDMLYYEYRNIKYISCYDALLQLIQR